MGWLEMIWLNAEVVELARLIGSFWWPSMFLQVGWFSKEKEEDEKRGKKKNSGT